MAIPDPEGDPMPEAADPDVRAAYARFHAELAAAHSRLARALAPEEALPPPLGPRQEEALALLDRRPEGATAREVADVLGLDVANTHTLLDSLVRRGLAVRMVARPMRWRSVAAPGQ